MGPPQSMRIGAVDYTVHVVADLKDGSQKLSGWIQHERTRIWLERDQSAQVMRQTLWHEVLHALLVQAGHDGTLSDPVIEALAYGIVGVLRDNLWLAEPASAV
jgi:hypothetical protein